MGQPGQGSRLREEAVPVLALVCIHSSMDYHVVPGIARDDALADPHRLAQLTGGAESEWWRPSEPVKPAATRAVAAAEVDAAQADGAGAVASR